MMYKGSALECLHWNGMHWKVLHWKLVSLWKVLFQIVIHVEKPNKGVSLLSMYQWFTILISSQSSVNWETITLSS